MPRTLLAAGLAAVALALPVAGQLPVAPPPRPAEPVADLIRDLGSPDFAARERASARLAGLDLAEPPPALLAAAAAPDPEVRRRAAAAAAAIRARAAVRGLTPAERFARAGAVDRFVAGSAAWAGPADDPRLWRPAVALVKALNARIKNSDSGEWHCWADVARYGDQVHSRFVKVDQPYRPPEPNHGYGISASGVVAPALTSPTGISYSTVIVRGPVTARTPIQQSVVLAGGDVTIGTNCSSSIVIADGDVDIGGGLLGALVIARGNIRVRNMAFGGAAIAGGKVVVDKPKVFPPGDENAARATVIVENDPNPLGFVTWWELSHAGVEAAKADGGVAITKAAPGWPFAKAGIAKGDLVTKVGEHPVATPEELRRRLRDAHATAAEAAVLLRRDGKDLTVRVPLPH